MVLLIIVWVWVDSTARLKPLQKEHSKVRSSAVMKGAEVVQERNICDNYYTGSDKAYGAASVTWNDWVAKATKVSSIARQTALNSALNTGYTPANIRG